MVVNDHPSNFHGVTSRNILASAMLELHQKGATWRQIGEQYRITSGMAYRIAMQDYDPVDPKIRQRLGLDAPTAWVDMSVEQVRWALDHREVFA